jgi:hypothetical protein
MTPELYHHGIMGQKWGKRNGPPYPLGGGDYTPSEKYYKYKKHASALYKKRHMDSRIRADKDTLSTLSYDQNRTKDAEMFYATYKKLDKHQYNALFNKKIPKTLYDENGNEIGTGEFLKYRIDNNVRKDLKVASEDSGAKVFSKLYSKDRDFYNFVTDENRMQEYFVKDKYKFKGYRESKVVLDKMKDDPKYVPTGDDLQKVYRMFNYVIPYDGAGNARSGHDMANQRAKFFKELKGEGYGAVLDTNDAIYGAFKAQAPVIVFDMQQVVPKSVYQTKMSDKVISSAITAGNKAIRGLR